MTTPTEDDGLRAIAGRARAELHTFERISRAMALELIEALEAAALRSSPAVDWVGEPVAWSFCPECGSEEIRYEEGRHKQCANCGQEWFSDIDYTDVCAKNLRRLFDSPTSDRASVVEEIAAERRRQVDAEGWTPDHDDEHETGQMASAAACYASPDDFATKTVPRTWSDDSCYMDATATPAGQVTVPSAWPWDGEWWKPKDRRRDLVKAAALLVAEIERLDRAALSPRSS